MLLVLLVPLALRAQRAVQLGGQRFVPEQNLARGTRLPDAGRLGAALGGQRNALVQLRELPTAADIQALAARGITLGDYLGGHAYHALVAEGAALPSLSGGNRLTALVAVRPEWKLHPALRGGAVPEHARAGADGARVVVRYAANATPAQVAEALGRLGLRDVEVVPAFRAAYAEMPLSASEGVASLPWVLAVDLVPLPPSLFNREGRIIGRASVLNTPASLGGRGLQGRGVRVGIWDASVTQHVDFGNRVHVQEYEDYDPHGTHVTGTILGAGLLNPDARGMAPAAHAYTHNFNTQKNGLSAQQEMAIAKERFNIALTQNSYGIYLAYVCSRLEQIVYSASDYNLDRLACEYPTLQHIFAAGNDQASCGGQLKKLYGQARYFTASNRSKNSIHVGAVDRYGDMTGFSSWGPQPDGRMFPTICAKGEDVLSTVPPNGYGRMDGTSMACPTVTGTAALLAERYAQLHQGRDIPNALLRALLANTATDAGRPGPDFQYGFGVMHAEHAAQALENGWFIEHELEPGSSFQKQVDIPENATGVRVMLVWNDPAVAKVYTLKDATLVNDLNLSVSAGVAGTSWKPWVCDPKNVDKDATRGEDNLNNIEQVTLTRAELGNARILKMDVAARRVVEGKQPCVLTWFFETPEPRVVSPADGMLCSQGATATLAVENVKNPYTVDFSYDGGATWTPIGRVKDAWFTLPVRIPTDAPITTKALVRVVDAEGHVAKSPHPFTIAPQPEKLELTTSECGTSGWKLTWEKNAAATNGYAVLLADPDKGGEFTKIGETTADKTEFDIPNGKVDGIERPIFSVAAKVEGDIVGKRAEGVLGLYSTPVKLAVENLPFVEDFTKYPSRYFSVKTGANVEAKYINSSYEAAGGNLFGLVCTSSVAGFNTDDYFDATRNATNMGSLTLCELDLTSIPADQNALLHIYGQIGTADESDYSTARMRIKADVNGDKILTSIAGLRENQGTEYNQDWCYMLQGGQKHKVVMEFSGQSMNDLIAVVSIKVEKPVLEPAVDLATISMPSDGANLTTGSCRLMLINQCAQTLNNLVVKAYRGDKWIAQATVEELKGRTGQEVGLEVDLSTANPLGEQIPLRFECEVNPLDPSKNGHLEYTVNNIGQVMAQGDTQWVNTWFGPMPRDPRITYNVKEKAIYTDMGGVLGNYKSQQQSTVKFLPTDPNMKVRVRFKKFKTVDQRAELIIYTADVPSDLSTRGVRMRDVLMGDVIKEGDEPVTYISEASDGGVTCFFYALTNSDDEGWVAEVDMVPGKNPLAITGGTISLVKPDGAERENVPVTVKIKNRWDTPAKDVEVSLLQNNKYLIIEEIPVVNPGEQEYTLNKKLGMPISYPVTLQAAIQGDDNDASDNQTDILALYDRYCLVTGLKDKGNYTSNIRIYDAISWGTTHKDGTIRYNLVRALPVYKGDNQLEIKVTPRYEAAEGWSVAAWIDWNDDAQFSDTEKQVVPMVKESKEPLSIVFPDLASKDLGVKRVRIIMAPTADITDPCTTLPGDCDVQDFTIELKDGHYPQAGDLALSRLDIGKSGKNLKTDQVLTVMVSNLSNHDFDGKAKVKITVDTQAPVEEEIDFSGTEKLEAYSGKKAVTLTHKADFSAAGRHTVTVELLNNPVEENNTVTASVFCSTPTSTGLFALNVKSLDKGREGLEGATLGKKLTGLSNFSIDIMFRLDKAQFSTLINGSRFKLYTTKNVVAGGTPVPDNALAMHIGDAMLRWTNGDIVKPGQWQHLTITVADIVPSTTCTLKIYIDGVECELDGNGRNGAPRFGGTEPWVFPIVDGQFKFLRVADVALEPAAIKKFQYVRQTDGTLPEHYLAEFTFDEGTGNKMTFSGEDAMEILTPDLDRITATENGLWVKIEKLIAGFKFVGQAKVEETGTDAYTITFDKGTDKAHVKGTIEKEWPEANLTYNGNPITENTEFNFSSPVQIVANANLFNKQLTQTVTLTFAEDASKECDLLTLQLEKSKNAGLQKDVNVSPITQSILIRLAEDDGTLTDPTKVKPTFSVSPEAELYHLDTKLVSGVTEVDLSSPTVITVKAANGTKKSYTLQLAQPQTIAWKLDKTEYTYGDKPVASGITVNSGLAPVVTSDHPEVASVAGGQLVIGKPGIAALKATRPSSGMWDAAEPKDMAITVGKKPVTVKVANKKYPVGYTLDLAYDYTTLVNPQDARSMPNPLDQNCFTVKDANGATVQPNGALPVGKYTVTADPAKTYETSYYKVTPESGSFEMVQGDLWRVSISVTESANPLQEATIILGEESETTGADGVVAWYLPAGKSYSFTVRKEGYSDEIATADLTTGKNVDLTVDLKKATLTLTYSVDGTGGKLAGKLNQMVAPDGTGQPVMAEPDANYMLDKWSDNTTENPHVARNVAQNTEIKAIFKEIKYTLTYKVEDGGKFKDATKATQEVVRFAKGEYVEVEAADENHYFKGWSDGVTTLKRQDQALANMEVTALFGTYATLPGSNDFENGLGDGWYTLSSGTSTALWEVTQSPLVGYPPLDGHFAGIEPAWPKPDGKVQAALYSPCYKLENGWNSELAVSMNYTVYAPMGRLKLQMCVNNNGVWMDALGAFKTALRTPGFKVHTVPAAQLSGKKSIQFRWLYTTTTSSGAELDNILITKPSTEKFKVHYIAEPAGAATFDKLKDDGTVEQAGITEQEVVMGQKPANVEAKVNGSYKFVRWSNGEENVKLTKQHEVYREQTYTAYLSDPATATITYQVITPDAGYVEVEGSKVQSQTIPKGNNAKAAKAVANPGYKFLFWDGDLGTNEETIAPTGVQENLTLTAHFVQVPPEYTVTFTITDADGGAALNGATIEINGQTLTANASGKATIDLPNGTYPYTAKMDGYDDKAGNITVNGGAVEVAVALTKKATATYTVTFTVTDADGGAALNGATVEINGKTLAADASGKATIDLPNGTYPYTAKMDGYDDKAGSVTVNGAAVEVAVALTKKATATYTVTFTVTDADGGAAINGATIEINGKTLAADASGKATIDLPNGNYPYTAKMDGYEDKAGSITVNGAAVEVAVALTKKGAPTYTVTFTVTDADGGAAINGATIEINGKTLAADASGKATIDLPNGNYPYTAKMDGYEDKAGSITVNGAAVEVAVALTKKGAPTYTVTFTVTDADGGAAINGATIEINGKTLTADASGKATIDLPNGNYPYTAKMDGYEDKAGSITVNGAAVDEAIALTKKATATYTLTFTVRDAQPQPLAKAIIKINNQTLTTDAKGVATISLPNGAYPYTVTLNGYKTANGTAQVQGKDRSISVTLVKEIFNAVESSLLAGVEAYPNPCDAELHLRNVAALRSLRVVNALGQTVLTRTHDGAETMVVTTDTLPAGLYLLHLTDTAGGIHILRFAKR